MIGVDRLFCARTVVVLGMAWGILATRKMWTSSRHCPRAPLLDNLPRLPWESEMPAVLLTLLTVIAVMPHPLWPILGFVVLLWTLCLYDWTRMRPWVYQNSFLLLAVAFCPPAEALNVFRLVTVSIYFWAGVLKVNAAFFQVTYPWLIGPLVEKLPTRTGAVLQRLGYAAPLVEAGLALGLLFPSTRLLALVAAVLMHLLILACFSRLGHKNYGTIWPWNVSMLLTGIAVFGNTGQVRWTDILFGQNSAFHLVALVLFALVPFCGLFNLVDPVFSHAHMSGRHVFGTLVLSRRMLKQLPPEVQFLCVRTPAFGGAVHTLTLSHWYLQELRVPPPQQDRLLRGIARSFAPSVVKDEDVQLTVFRPPSVFSTTYRGTTYSWADLV